MNEYEKLCSNREVEELWKGDIERWLKVYLDRDVITPTEIRIWIARFDDFKASKEELNSFYSITGWKTKYTKVFAFNHRCGLSDIGDKRGLFEFLNTILRKGGTPWLIKNL